MGEQTELTGDLEVQGGIRIDGRIKGDIKCDSVVYLGETAWVQGNITAEALISSGKVEGNVHSRQHIQVTLPGSIKGDIETSELVLEKGVYFQGTCRMTAPGHG
ncbi:MAG TPA: polymer-forming cytoskeletal protein [bacterium]|nr:polymer-forming cytoskeletal protein [bacterium]